ncbi:unnamed protein product [Caenorhabditis auriculariae]|uniref:BCAS3 WD40 domain-containing protein n=1 Tax=Caenorhabditis auriculariae TaxID=2777116 RepID=A0A8S1GXV4_9PELO|nr:unnamed protein product [Caenorhabditis auriculariae]
MSPVDMPPNVTTCQGGKKNKKKDKGGSQPCSACNRGKARRKFPSAEIAALGTFGQQLAAWCSGLWSSALSILGPCYEPAKTISAKRIRTMVPILTVHKTTTHYTTPPVAGRRFRARPYPRWETFDELFLGCLRGLSTHKVSFLSSLSSGDHALEESQMETLIDTTADSLAKDLIVRDPPRVSPAPKAPPRKSHQQLNGGATTAATSSSSASSSPAGSMRGESHRKRLSSHNYIKGQIVKAVEPPSSTIVGSMAELVNEMMPASQSQAAHLPQFEKAEWVQISSVEKAGKPGERLDVVVVGLIRGFQIWTINENGDCEEVMSERQGPIRACRILPNNISIPSGTRDPFASVRPLIALVDASSHVPDRQYCSVSLVSLNSGKEVHRIAFDEPVTALNTSNQYLVVSLSSRAFVYELVSFAEARHVRLITPPEGCPPAIAITGQMLAYADLKLNSDVQSCGGMAVDVETAASDHSAATHVMSAMKMFSRTMTSIGESVGATSSSSPSKLNSVGVVTVVDLETQSEQPTDGVVCHWMAHTTPVSHLAFSPDGRLLLTADASASVFNVFLLLPHSGSPTLAAVQHLYKLHRGNTAAKVSSTAFSLDGRWLAISTNHGTCHVFSICPFGGRPTQRTHGDQFVNKESRFLRSAGLTDSADATASMAPSRVRALSGTPTPNFREHPELAANRGSGNSRVGPFPPPIFLHAVRKIKDPKYSTDNLTAWATDLTALPIATATSAGASAASNSGTRRRVDVPRIAVAFSAFGDVSLSSSGSVGTANPALLSLLIIRTDTNLGAVMCNYELRPRLADPSAAAGGEEPPKLNASATALWTLQRTKNNADMHPPMPQGSPLMALATPSNEVPQLRPGEELWTPHVEVRTYSAPHRCIWQGPQFEFYEYKEEDSAVLMSPSADSRHTGSGFKSIPVVVGGGIPITRGTSATSDATRIECGSYTSQTSLVTTMATADSDISQKIADAMRDLHSTSPPQQIDTNNHEEFFDTHSPSGDRRLLDVSGRQNQNKKTLVSVDDVDLDFPMDDDEDDI